MTKAIYKQYKKDKEGLSKAIEHAYRKKYALYLYPDCIIVKEPMEEDCYLSKTTIIESEYYDTFEEFNKEVNEIYDFKMSA